MISKEQYGEWKNSPATQFFRKFLLDRHDALIKAINQAWLAHQHLKDEHLSEMAEARGRILELSEMQNVPFELIQAFYEEMDASGSESSQSGEGQVYSSPVHGEKPLGL